jgi:hypothetical protein
MAVSGQFHGPVAFSRGKEPPVYMYHAAALAPEPVRTVWKTEKSLCSLEVINSNFKSFTQQPHLWTWTHTIVIFTNVNTHKIVRIQTRCKNAFPFVFLQSQTTFLIFNVTNYVTRQSVLTHHLLYVRYPHIYSSKPNTCVCMCVCTCVRA